MMDPRDREAFLRLIQAEIAKRVREEVRTAMRDHEGTIEGIVLRHVVDLHEKLAEVRTEVEGATALSFRAKRYVEERTNESVPPVRGPMDTGDWAAQTSDADRTIAHLSTEVDRLRSEYQKIIDKMLESHQRLETAEQRRQEAEQVARTAKQETELTILSAQTKASVDLKSTLNRIAIMIVTLLVTSVGAYFAGQEVGSVPETPEIPAADDDGDDERSRWRRR